MNDRSAPVARAVADPATDRAVWNLPRRVGRTQRDGGLAPFCSLSRSTCATERTNQALREDHAHGRGYEVILDSEVPQARDRCGG